MMTDIQLNIHHKTYPQAQQPIIQQLKLLLHSNEFICLVGQNGCGKTTLLNCIAGLETFTGDIRVGEQCAQPKIGYVFQQPRLLPWRTVRENIELVLNPSQQKQDTAFVDALLNAMQLTAYQHAYPSALSGGMMRRVSIICAFAVNPDVLLMDEPFVALDAPMAREVRTLLMRLWLERPHTVLFVTHDLREAIALADRLIFLAAKPMRVISELVVPIARTERDNEQAIEAFRQQLLTEHPAIKQLL